MPEGPQAALEEGLTRLDLALAPTRVRALLRYIELLARWNRAYNLTAVRAPSQMVARHLLDSLATLRHVRGPRLLDLGTGAGLPGLPLAIGCPDLYCVLLDGNAKKTRFCRQAVLELGLANVEVVHARVADFAPAEPFSSAIARAFGTVAKAWAAAGRLLRPGGRLLAMKGVYPTAELEELGSMGENARVVPLHVPGIDAERHLVILSR